MSMERATVLYVLQEPTPHLQEALPVQRATLVHFQTQLEPLLVYLALLVMQSMLIKLDTVHVRVAIQLRLLYLVVLTVIKIIILTLMLLGV
jgi:hypothetical protein